MRTIEVDFDVFKELTLRRPSEEVSENAVLRKLLGLQSKPTRQVSETELAPNDWIAKGVRFPLGTEFRATHKGQTHLARVDSGSLSLNGRRFESPSAAATAITGNPVNGWRFWECRLPGKSAWESLDAVRKRQASGRGS